MQCGYKVTMCLHHKLTNERTNEWTKKPWNSANKDAPEKRASSVLCNISLNNKTMDSSFTTKKYQHFIHDIVWTFNVYVKKKKWANVWHKRRHNCAFSIRHDRYNMNSKSQFVFVICCKLSSLSRYFVVVPSCYYNFLKWYPFV